MKSRLQSSTAPSQQASRALDPAHLAEQHFRFAWIGPAQAMRHLDINSLTSLYRLITDHELPFGRVGRRYRFRRDQLDQWVERRGLPALAEVRRRA